MKSFFIAVLSSFFYFKSNAQRIEIYGFIHNKIDSLSVVDVNVSLYNAKDSLIEKTLSDSIGKFIFKKVDSGTYYIVANKKEYSTETLKNLKFSGLPNCPLRIYLKRKK
jgi:hypothetical protein